MITPDPRGDGPVIDPPTLENGQSNIINYMNQEPLLFGLGQNSSHEYPGKIVINNESRYVDREVKKNTIPGPAETGKYSTGHDTTEPTLPTGAPQPVVIPPEETDHNMHGLNFNHKINFNENITVNPPEAQRKTNEEEIILQPFQEAAFIEGDHPRAAAGGSQGGHFVSKEGGDELGSGMQLKYKTTIQGIEIDVNLRQKKTWEKHTSDEQRNDPDFNTRYSDDLKAQGQGEDKPAEPTITIEPTAEPEQAPGGNWENKIDRDLYNDLPGDANATAKERLFPWKKRQAMFADTEEANGKYAKLSDEIESKRYYKEQYEDDLKKFQEDPSKFHPSNEDTFKHNIKVGEEEIARLDKERAAVRDDLLAKGKFEYKEVQDYLRSRQTFMDDLKRRKEGSGAYWKDMGQITAHDRVIDQLRTGKRDGHFPGAEHEEMLKKRREQSRIDYDQRTKEREEKNLESNKKMKQENEDAHARLTKAGLDIDAAAGKFKTNPTDRQYEYPEKIRSDSTVPEQKGFLKNYKQVLQNKTDMMQIRVNNDKMSSGYASNYDERDLKDLQWRNRHFVDDHKMNGVLAFNDGDKSTFDEYQNRWKNSSPLAKSQVKEIKLYKSGGPRRSGKRRNFVMMGSWDNHGGVSLFFNSKSARNKMAAMGIEKEDWLTTADHEFAHADWQGVTDTAGKGQQFNDVNAARQSFIADVNDAYDNKDFTLHAYTDTYRTDRREDLLANEAHSKIREFEIDGSLSRRMRFAQDTISASQEFGAPSTTLGKEQLVSANGLVKMVDSYNDLRGEMNKL